LKGIFVRGGVGKEDDFGYNTALTSLISVKFQIPQRPLDVPFELSVFFSLRKN
jgi:hypothetical protein